MKQPIEIYTSIQSFVKNEIQSSLRVSDTKKQYDVAPVSQHIHQQTDSNQISFSALQSAPQYIVIRRVNIPYTSVLTMNTSPVILVPAQGLTSIVLVESVTAFLRFVSAAYTGVNPIEIRYTNGSGTQVTDSIPQTFTNSGTTTYYQVNSVSHAPTIGAQIVASIPGGNPATGNSSLILTVKYRLVPFQ